MLQTKKGTTFYVLTVAGEHGIPAEKAKTSDDKAADVPAFMTEVSGLSARDGKPDYIASIDIPESTLIEIKKMYVVLLYSSKMLLYMY